MKPLTSIYQFLFDPRVEGQHSISETKRIKLTSFITSSGIFITLIYLSVFSVIGMYRIVALDAAYILISLIVLYINHKGHYIPARIIFISILYIQFFILSCLFGEEAMVHILFIPSAAAALVLFDLSYLKTIVFYVAFAFAAVLVLYAIHFPAVGVLNLSLEVIYNVKISFIITAILGEVIVIYSLIYNFNFVERKLDESNELLQQQLQSIFENSLDALFLVDWQENKIIRANQRAVELFEVNAESDFYNHSGQEFHKVTPTPYELNTMRDRLNHGEKYEKEVLFITKKENEFWGSLAIKLVVIGNKKFQSVRVTDITSEKKTKAQIEASLREKEILLAEIHHRVKNNMAVISGLLGLQSNYVEDARAKELFEESRNRIHSMALIHDKLYQHETFARIDFEAYINDLVEHIRSSYNSSETIIHYKVNCKEVFIDIQNAVPCGLILNELISNAYKHAFNGRDEGEIQIVCTQMGGKFTMMVSDNGVGFDADKALAEPVSLGLTLINALVEQVNGSLKTVNKNGTAYYISFEE